MSDLNATKGKDTDSPKRDQRGPLQSLALVGISGVMLGFSFPPSSFGILACVGLVPLLMVIDTQRRLRSVLWYTYVAMLLFHVITLNWTGGYQHGNDPYMMIAGAVTMLLHPVFYFLPVGAYYLVRSRLGTMAALFALPMLWVGYEFTHSLSEWSFPWLTLGNSQSYDITGIQFIRWTGVYGLSLWILVLNVIALHLVTRLADGTWELRSRAALLTVGLWVAVFFLPRLEGTLTLAAAEEEPATPVRSYTVGMVQPNLDPWEKWSVNGDQTLLLYRHLTDSMVSLQRCKALNLILWPETAIPFYLLASVPNDRQVMLQTWIDSLGIPLLSGLPHAVVYPDPTLAPPSAKRNPRTGMRYDSYNAAGFFQPGLRDATWYGKMKMVPFAERVPYADLFHFVGFLQWGVGIGGWQIGPDTTVFADRRTGARFSAIICYESTYPGFVTEFVKRGAQMLGIITVDSWWGTMSGAYQHHRFAVFRAIENRRWIARCALGGISCFIDPYGRTHEQTGLLERALVCGTVELRDDLTFYTRHGDWLGEACLWLGLAFVAGAIGRMYLNKNRELTWR
jgi:apolipoprotein N-acyltransferase